MDKRGLLSFNLKNVVLVKWAYEGFESKQFLLISFYQDRVHFIYEI
jgi:hypothetical protein